MITFVRTANIHDGKAQEAMAWAIKAAGYISENLGVNLQVMRNIGGMVSQVHWVANYESLSDFEAAMAKIEADAGYQQLLAEGRDAGGLFAASSIVDNLYASVP